MRFRVLNPDPEQASSLYCCAEVLLLIRSGWSVNFVTRQLSNSPVQISFSDTQETA